MEKTWLLALFGRKAWTNPLGFWSKFQICSNFLYSLREPRNDVWSGFQSDWKQIGRKLVFSAFLFKKHALTHWDFGQTFKVPQTFCIGKTSREMMFGVVFRVIGKKLEENCFLAVFWPKSMD